MLTVKVGLGGRRETRVRLAQVCRVLLLLPIDRPARRVDIMISLGAAEYRADETVEYPAPRPHRHTRHIEFRLAYAPSVQRPLGHNLSILPTRFATPPQLFQQYPDQS